MRWDAAFAILKQNYFQSRHVSMALYSLHSNTAEPSTIIPDDDTLILYLALVRDKLRGVREGIFSGQCIGNSLYGLRLPSTNRNPEGNSNKNTDQTRCGEL
jgi:hypothetical protein